VRAAARPRADLTVRQTVRPGPRPPL